MLSPRRTVIRIRVLNRCVWKAKEVKIYTVEVLIMHSSGNYALCNIRFFSAAISTKKAMHYGIYALLYHAYENFNCSGRTIMHTPSKWACASSQFVGGKRGIVMPDKGETQ